MSNLPVSDLPVSNLSMQQPDFFARSAVLDGYIDTARRFDADTNALLKAHNIVDACLTMPDMKIPMANVIRLLEDTAVQCGAPDFGIHMAQARSASTLGAIELIMREQATLRDALSSLITYLFAQIEGMSVEIDETDGTCTLGIGVSAELPRPAIQTVELALGSLVHIITRLLGKDWRPDMVMFEHQAPEGLTQHARYLGQTPLFDFGRNALAFSGDELDAPLPTANPQSAKQVEAYFAALMAPREETYRAKVSDHIQILLPQGQCRIDRIAALLGVTRRTVHRRLAAEGVSFTQLVEQNRGLLEDVYAGAGTGVRSKTEIARLLGFANLSSYSRWSKARRRGALISL